MPRCHLSLDERRRLARLRESRMPVTESAAALGRHRSTIYRELKRNWWRDAEVPQADGYWPVSAQALAARLRPRQARPSIRPPGRGHRPARGRLVARADRGPPQAGSGRPEPAVP
jgi:IS30 family transposase